MNRSEENQLELIHTYIDYIILGLEGLFNWEIYKVQFEIVTLEFLRKG